MVWYGLVHGMVWYGMVWYSLVHGMVWYGMVWYGMVWYGMVWYGKHCKFNRAVLTRGSHFSTIIWRVIFTPQMRRFDVNSRFDSGVGSK